MGKRANPAVIGAFVIGAVVLAVIAVGLFGSGRLFRTSYQYVVFFTGDVNGLKIGAPVKLKGVEVGRVANVLLNVSQLSVFQAAEKAGSFSSFNIPVLIELDADAFTQRGGHLSPTPETMKKLVDLGLRARLSMESFVTGVLYVELDLLPHAPLRYVADPTVPYTELPSLPTPLEEVRMEAVKFLAKLQEVDVKSMVDSLARTAGGIDRLVNSPQLMQVVTELPATMDRVDQAIRDVSTTLASVRQLSDGVNKQVEPTARSLQATAVNASDAMLAAKSTLENIAVVFESDSSLMSQISRSLEDLSIAAVSVRRLAEELDRNPSVLLRGKTVSEDAP